MFLNKLSTDDQVKFLRLAVILCHADGNYSEAERQMMRLYVGEIGCEDGMDILENLEKEEEKHQREREKYFQLAYRFRSVIEEVKENSDIKGRKIILFELMGLAYVDKSFSENERKLINDSIEALEFSSECQPDSEYYFSVAGIEDMLKRYLKLQEEMTSYVLG